MPSDILQCSPLGSPDAIGALSVSGLSTAEVYEQQFRYVWRCLRALGVRDDQLDDAVHDVFLVVQRKLWSFDGNARLTTWLYAIALRIAQRYRARASKDAATLVATSSMVETEFGGDRSGSEANTDAEGELERAGRLDLARRALQGLDDDKREAFVLAHVEQLPASEIAKITGLPINTVYSRIRAARRAFSAQLARLQLARRPR